MDTIDIILGLLLAWFVLWCIVTGWRLAAKK